MTDVLASSSPADAPAPQAPASGPAPPSVAYLWTADDQENSRLDFQHHMLSDCAWSGKPYLAPAEAVLGPEGPDGGEGKAILDLGTGSGIWAIDMALRWPKAKVLGVDLAPKVRPTPPNCRLEVHDINSGLSQWDGQFDYVHTRLISSGIRDYPLMLSRIAPLLRPGGLLDLSEWDFRIYAATFEPLPLVPRGQPGHSWVAEWLWALRQAGAARGGQMDAASHMEQWVRESGVWEDVGYWDTWIATSAPTGETDEELAHNTALWLRMKEDAKHFAAAARPVFAQKMAPEKLEELMTGLRWEVDEGPVSMYARLQTVWGRKVAVGSPPKTEVPGESEPVKEGSSS
ncbi:S-adenosyl-L-methionine-dependent methyltransferase [Calocera viscosa TUFC12733]|uniref:S-adenosyl-L-methionine-dependent methyltransferase n=1 Tax=Calocera viscosa (strain TUFC12733) TaxID=1330018 RepID=A0A167GIS5_CALVF|nr:S-adenosyl-L-methionine-dependent methyltransferase [Calocera viscosa TUFC12733]